MESQTKQIRSQTSKPGYCSRHVLFSITAGDAQLPSGPRFKKQGAAYKYKTDHRVRPFAIKRRRPPQPDDSTMITCSPVQDASEQSSSDASDPTRNRFYLVVVQYAAKLSAQKISAAVMHLKPGGQKLSRARCNLQVAPEDVSGANMALDSGCIATIRKSKHCCYHLVSL